MKENPNLTLEFRDPKEKVYLMTTLPQNYDRRGRLESVLMVTQDVTAEKERERDYQLQLKKRRRRTPSAPTSSKRTSCAA